MSNRFSILVKKLVIITEGYLTTILIHMQRAPRCRLLSQAVSLCPKLPKSLNIGPSIGRIHINNCILASPSLIVHFFGYSSNNISRAMSTKAVTTSEVPEGHQLITEGSIQMMYPQSENSVFYNPVQVQNRDLSVLMISLYAQRNIERKWVINKKKEVRKQLIQEKGDPMKVNSKEERKNKITELDREIKERVQKEKIGVDFPKLTRDSGFNSGAVDGETSSGLTVLEALAASGLRSLRYWKEIPGIASITVNDLDPVAIELARENVVRNGMESSLADKLKTTEKNYSENINEDDKQKHRPLGITLQVGDATHEMYMSRLPPTLPPSQQNPSQLQQKPQYDVIDLDPYGSASPFLDAAIQSIKSGGLLAVTCTDMAALGGSHPETW